MDVFADMEKIRRAYEWAKGAEESYQKKRSEAILFCDTRCKSFTLNGQKPEDREAACKYDEFSRIYGEVAKAFYAIEITLSDALGIDPDAEQAETEVAS